MSEELKSNEAVEAVETTQETVAADQEATTQAPPREEEVKEGRNLRKVRYGRVVSNKMEKSIVVLVERRVKHPIYGKFVKKSKKLVAHDENNDAGIGDSVRIMETRPISKRKRWRLLEITERAK